MKKHQNGRIVPCFKLKDKDIHGGYARTLTGEIIILKKPRKMKNDPLEFLGRELKKIRIKHRSLIYDCLKMIGPK